MADIRWFASEPRRAVLVCRWDVNPGREEVIRWVVPEGAEVTGVWLDDDPIRWKREGLDVKVSLPLTRLAQSIQMVCEVATASDSGSFPLPTLQDIPVVQTWLSVYQPNRNKAAVSASVTLLEDWTASTRPDYELAQGMSIRAATESSMPRVSERSQEQVIRWIQSWDQRFRSLAAEANLTEVDDKKNADGEQANAKDKSVWEEQVRKWQQYLRRIAVPSDDNSELAPAQMIPPNDWSLAAVAKHVGVAKTSPRIHIAQESSVLAIAIRGILSVAIAIGLCVLLWHKQAWFFPLVTHPATWLFVTGLSSLAVAPVPVAIAVCIVALSAPLLTSSSLSKSR